MTSPKASFAKLAIKSYKKSHATPLQAFFTTGRALGVSVTVQGKDEAWWKAAAKANMEKVFDKLDDAIRVKAGKESLVFDWADTGKLVLCSQ